MGSNFMPRSGVGDTPSSIEDFSKKSRPTFAKWPKLLNKEGVNETNFMLCGEVRDPPSFYRRF